jgi:hypothetical protein
VRVTIGHPRVSLALIIGLQVIGALAAGCSEPERFELTVRLREPFDWAQPTPVCLLNIVVLPATAETAGGAQRCSFEAAAHVWRGDDGSRAVVTTHATTIYLTIPTSSTVECAGRPIPGAWWVRLHPDERRDGGTFNVQTDEGSTLELHPETGLWATSPRGTDRCFEMSGTWRGVAGELLSRTGTYTMIDDSIQTVLQLVEQ